MRIYIAGPYCAKDCSLHGAVRITQMNVDHAISAFHKLKALGHTPFVPHLSHYLHIHPSCPEDYAEWWYEYDYSFLDNWAEAIFMLKGWENSKGSCMELKRARGLGLTVFFEEEGKERIAEEVKEDVSS
jgi:hypothetical protein